MGPFRVVNVSVLSSFKICLSNVCCVCSMSVRVLFVSVQSVCVTVLPDRISSLTRALESSAVRHAVCTRGDPWSFSSSRYSGFWCRLAGVVVDHSGLVWNLRSSGIFYGWLCSLCCPHLKTWSMVEWRSTQGFKHIRLISGEYESYLVFHTQCDQY